MRISWYGTQLLCLREAANIDAREGGEGEEWIGKQRGVRVFEAAAEESYQNGWTSQVYSQESAHKYSIPVEYTMILEQLFSQNTQGFSKKKQDLLNKS